MNTSSTAGDLTQPSHEDEVNIHVVEEIVGESKTDEQSPNQLPGPPVEVFTTTVNIFLEWLVAETLTNPVKCIILMLVDLTEIECAEIG